MIRAHVGYTYCYPRYGRAVMTEGRRERGGAAAMHRSPLRGQPPAPREPAYCQVQCQGHARATATARRNAGAADGREPPRRASVPRRRPTHTPRSAPAGAAPSSPD